MSNRLRIAVLLSLALHALLLTAVWVMRPGDQPPDRYNLTNQGGIELLPVEVMGAEAESQTASSETTPPPTAAAPPDPSPPVEQHAEGADVPVPNEPTPPEPPSAQQSSLSFNFAGTDSLSNATVTGPNLIPASPDNKARNRPPIYPMEAARQGQRGTVIVLIHVSPFGVTEGAEIMQSSGFQALDQAALDAVRSWRFRPAIQDGQAIAFDMPMKFVFTIQ